MFPQNVSRSEYKCVIYLSVEFVLTDFHYIWKSDTSSFLTQFLVLPHFWDISNSNLTDFWQILESDSFLTHIRHISDSFLTYFFNWHISDSFQTVFWQIYEIGGTNKSKEYQKLVVHKPSNRYCGILTRIHTTNQIWRHAMNSTHNRVTSNIHGTIQVTSGPCH